MDLSIFRRAQKHNIPRKGMSSQVLVVRRVPCPTAETSKGFDTFGNFLRKNGVHSISIAITALACLLSVATLALGQDDLFSKPTAKKSKENPYSTASAFFAAARNGVIPEILHGDDYQQEKILVPAIYDILVKEYGLNPGHLYGGSPEPIFELLLKNLTKYELGDNKQWDLQCFRDNQNMIFGLPDDKVNRPYNDSRAAFNKFARDYDNALKEYVAGRKKIEEQRELAAVEDRRRAEVRAKEADEIARQQKEATNARASSLKAEEDIRDAAMNDALEKAKRAREQKLKTCLESPEYQRWEAALQVQQGERMIAQAQRALDHDDAVQRESGVTDLSARRAAGEQMVAGKNLVETAFGTYKRMGGKATNASEIVAGPDPAADYR